MFSMGLQHAFHGWHGASAQRDFRQHMHCMGGMMPVSGVSSVGLQTCISWVAHCQGGLENMRFMGGTVPVYRRVEAAHAP